MNVGQRFKELRILKGFPKAGNVATFLGLPRSTVSAFENNQSSPSIETIRKFIDPLDITLAEFFESRLPKEFWRSPHRELLEMVIEILDSGDELIAGSLKSNILSSSDSIKSERSRSRANRILAVAEKPSSYDTPGKRHAAGEAKPAIAGGKTGKKDAATFGLTIASLYTIFSRYMSQRGRAFGRTVDHDLHLGVPSLGSLFLF